MMELVDMRDLGSRGSRRWGSSPHTRTISDNPGAARVPGFFLYFARVLSLLIIPYPITEHRKNRVRNRMHRLFLHMHLHIRKPGNYSSASSFVSVPSSVAL